MRDNELYQTILGLNSPWTVREVRLNQEQQEIEVYIEHPRATKFCCVSRRLKPASYRRIKTSHFERRIRQRDLFRGSSAAGGPVWRIISRWLWCQTELPCHDHAEERRWRHLDSCQCMTILVAAPPRVNCPEHGVKTAAVTWAEKHSRFTMLFERFAIDMLLATQTVKGATNILRLKWDQTWAIVERAVKRSKNQNVAKLLPRLGLDEKAFSKGHSYVTVLYDLDQSTVEAVSFGNDTESAIACFSELSPEQLHSVEAIALDMSPAYVKAVKQVIPLAEQKIVHDRFHVMQLATKAVDQVRRSEHKQLLREGDDCLTSTRYLWLTSQDNLTDTQQSRFEEVFRSELLTGKAWAYKEMLRDLWNHPDSPSATAFFQGWYRSVIHTRLAPMKKVARTIKQRLQNVVSYCTHRITNAVAEGMNSKIMSIKRRVGGFRNIKIAIYFYCGGLRLYPR